MKKSRVIAPCTLAFLVPAVSASAADPGQGNMPDRNCAPPLELLTIAQAGQTVKDILVSVPLEELQRIYEEQVDQNDDSNICLKIGDRVNPPLRRTADPGHRQHFRLIQAEAEIVSAATRHRRLRRGCCAP